MTARRPAQAPEDSALLHPALAEALLTAASPLEEPPPPRVAPARRGTPARRPARPKRAPAAAPAPG